MGKGLEKGWRREREEMGGRDKDGVRDRGDSREGNPRKLNNLNEIITKSQTLNERKKPPL